MFFLCFTMYEQIKTSPKVSILIPSVKKSMNRQETQKVIVTVTVFR